MEYLGLAEPGGAWGDRDRKLAEGLILHEGNTHTCGHNRDRSTNPDMDGWYEAVEDVCYACAALERRQADYGESNQPPPGTILRVVDTRPPDQPLPPAQPD